MSPTAITPSAPGIVSADSDSGSLRLVRFAIGLTVILLIVRLVMIGLFDLFFDEAYYWLWSTELAGSYYDHPPMVAVFVWLGTNLFGDSEFGVRVVGAVSVAIDAALIFGIARMLTDSRRIAAWAAIFMNVTTLAAFSVVIVPDQPMMLFWLVGLFALVRIAKGGAPQWWLLAGAAAGLAAASKFTTFFLMAAVPIWLVTVPQVRHWLRRPWPYLGLGLGVLVFSPVLIWNADHEWISFVWQFGREGIETIRVDSFLQFLTIIPLMLSPPIFVMAGAGVTDLLRRGWRQDSARALLVITPIPLTLFFVYHSFSEWIGAHWIAPLVAIGSIYAAIGIDAVIGPGWTRIVSFSHRIAVPFGLVITALFYFAIVEMFLPISRAADLTARFRGWEAYVEDQERVRVDAGARYILGRDYHSPAYVRFYLDDPPPAYQVGDPERWSHFGGLGTADPSLADATGIYVGKWGVDTEIAFITQYFATITRLGDIVRPLRPGVLIEDPVWLVSDPTPAAMSLFGLDEAGD